jgi:hypothetical protein
VCSRELCFKLAMETKFSIALLEAFCALGFVVCGVVLGFSFGGLIGPRLVSHGGQGLAEVGAMLNGAILGAAVGVGAAVGAFFRLSRARRQRFATSALALAALTALFTAVAVQRFGAW